MSRQKKVVLCFGDSTTAGSGTATKVYPRELQRLLGYEWSVFQLGFGGLTNSQIATRINLMDDKFSPAPKRIATVLGGINDIAGGTAAATAYATLQAGIETLVAGGFKVVWMTTAPAGGYSGLSAGEQTALLDYNALIAAYNDPDVTIVDVYELLEDDATPNQLSYQGTKPDYATSSVSPFGRDFLHFNNAGHLAIATVLTPIIQQL